MSNYAIQRLKTGMVYGFIFFVLHASMNYWFLKKDISTALTGGAIFGIVLGLFNAFFFNRFGVSKNILESISFDLDVDEKILFQSAANFTTQPVGLNGQFFITNKRIVFKQHQPSIDAEILSIGLHEIEKLALLKLLFIVDNGVAVHTHSNHVYHFTIDKMKGLKSFIRNSDQLSLHQ